MTTDGSTGARTTASAPMPSRDPLEPLPLLRRELGTGPRGLSGQEAARRRGDPTPRIQVGEGQEILLLTGGR